MIPWLNVRAYALHTSYNFDSFDLLSVEFMLNGWENAACQKSYRASASQVDSTSLDQDIPARFL